MTLLALLALTAAMPAAAGSPTGTEAVARAAAGSGPRLGPAAAEDPGGEAQPDPTAADDSLAELRAELATLRRDYDKRIEALETEVGGLRAALAAAQTGPPGAAPSQAATAPTSAAPPGQLGPPAQPVSAATSEPAPDDELAALRAAARAAAGVQTGEPPAGEPVAAGAPPPPATTGAGSLNRLNPEISITGDFRAVASSADRDEFQNREFELDVQSALDPFSRTRWTVAFDDRGEVEVEEGWIAYPSLPGGLGLTAGRFRQQFGALNRQHLHALPQSDYPLALRTVFGDEGLAQTGLSARWLLPRPWAGANELTVELTDGENDAFGGEDFEHLAALAHLKNYWDLGDAAYFELGLTGVGGSDAAGGDRRVWGADATFHWQPPARAKYRELTWRTELLRSEVDLPAGGSAEAWGGYSYLEGLVAQNLYAGARVDWVEDPFDPDHRRWGVVPYLTWWQSEFVRLRGEYRRFEDQRTGDADDSLLLQLTWAAGPHKHDTY